MSTSIVHRTCKKCQQSYPVTSEHWHKDKTSKDGFSYSCKECAKSRARKWGADNQEYVREQHREYYATHKQERRDYIEANAEKVAAGKRRWRQSNPDKVAEHKRRDAEKNRDRIRNYQREWYHRRKAAGALKPLTPEQRETARQRATDWYAENKGHAKKTYTRYYAANTQEIKARVKDYLKRNPDKARQFSKVRDANRRARELAAEGSFTAADIRLQYRAQRGKCWHCGGSVGDTYHVDHLRPLAKGGTNDPRNLVISCPTCNLSKGDRQTWEWNGRLF